MGHGYSADKVPDLKGKVAIITGGNTGIGKETARELARKGCHVILACRSKERAEPAVEDIKKDTKNDLVDFMQLDLGNLESIQAFATSFRERELPLHLLINNAAVMACPFALTSDGIELQFGTNHLGHFLLTNLLLDLLLEQEGSRIVNVSSNGHSLFPPKEGIRFDKLNDKEIYTPMTAYGQSKLCNVLFTAELDRRLKDKTIYINCLHPGFVGTELSRHVRDSYGLLAAGLSSIGKAIVSKSPENGALTSLYVATSPEIEEKAIRGQYFVPTAQLSLASELGRDEELAKKLWTFSEDLLKEKGVKASFLNNLDDEEGEKKSKKKKKEKKQSSSSSESEKEKKKD